MRVLYKTADGLTFSAQDGTLLAFEADTWLITDRTQQDVNYVKRLIAKIVAGTATELELAEWNSATLKGAYNYTDLNRVNAAMEQLKAQLEGYGYAVPGYRKVQIPHTKIPSSRLPSGYTELKYIEGTGTQYIDTGFTPNSNTRLVADMEITTGITSFLFGARHNSSANSTSYSFSMVQISGTSLRSDYGSVETAISVSPAQRLAIDKSGNTTTVNGTTVTATAQSFSGSYNLALFTVNTAGTINSTKTSAKLYSCQMYDSGNLVRDFVPCINPDGTYGLYDIVNEKFYGNAGTGSFTGGAVVEWDVISNEQTDYDPYLWYEIDIPTPQLMENYLANVQSIRNVLELLDSTPATPESMSELTYQMANAIEQILVDCQDVITSMSLVLPKTGQPTVFCGFCWYVLENT